MKQKEPPAEGLVPGVSRTLSKVDAGGEVRRMRWSQQLNESVIRAYYRATEGATNLTAYRSRLL